MHELSIALSMIELAADEAERRGAAGVSALYMKLGPLSGVVKHALLFSYEVASNGTLLEGSRLVIEDVPVAIYCSECQAVQRLESIQRFCCPVCGMLSSEVVRGRELEFVAMELVELGELADFEEIEDTAEPDKFATPVDQSSQSGRLEEVAT
jgi:hydrogenase nickel incorporation protein HypA/HybF